MERMEYIERTVRERLEATLARGGIFRKKTPR